jgi:hypothetical protein
MYDGLGYRRYAAHGSDLGAGVTAWVARNHRDAVLGIHLATPGLAPPPQPWSPAETDHFAEVERWSAEEGGYAHQHATKPTTLAAALDDSPAGLAAWIGEQDVSPGRPRMDRRAEPALRESGPASPTSGRGCARPGGGWHIARARPSRRGPPAARPGS